MIVVTTKLLETRFIKDRDLKQVTIWKNKFMYVMVPLKEDGSLDIELIKKLPFDDYLEALGSFTHQQLQEYMSKLPEDRTGEPMIAHKVDFDFDDPRSGVDADKYLAQQKKKYGIT